MFTGILLFMLNSVVSLEVKKVLGDGVPFA